MISICIQFIQLSNKIIRLTLSLQKLFATDMCKYKNIKFVITLTIADCEFSGRVTSPPVLLQGECKREVKYEYHTRRLGFGLLLNKKLKRKRYYDY